ncbi:MAG TPA: DUF3501 family protein [Acidimicrobiales bacterium]|nr:DUF3501 family protein [Acidimicrobiales bacterium]
MSDPSGGAPPGALTLADILDLRAYERVRDDYRRAVTEMKRRRRVALGPIMTLVFESFDTVRFQVHEMARAERIMTDEGIQEELDVYNRLLPAPGELSATLFIELTSEDQLRGWLPRLVGIERAIGFELPGGVGASNGGGAPAFVRAEPEAEHAGQLTRETVTPAVHYLRFPFGAEERRRFAAGPVALVSDHPEYRHRTELTDEVRAELLGDLEGRTERLAFG